jgi:hypothetical protein
LALRSKARKGERENKNVVLSTRTAKFAGREFISSADFVVYGGGRCKFCPYGAMGLNTDKIMQSENTDKATAELSAVVDELLNQLSTKFSTISSELLSKSEFCLCFAV